MEPFASLETMYADLGIPRSTLYDILTRDIGLKRYTSRWVSHSLTPQQRQKRIEMAGEMAKTLVSYSSHPGDIITCDESWFFHEYPHLECGFRVKKKLEREQNNQEARRL